MLYKTNQDCVGSVLKATVSKLILIIGKCVIRYRDFLPGLFIITFVKILVCIWCLCWLLATGSPISGLSLGKTISLTPNIHLLSVVLCVSLRPSEITLLMSALILVPLFRQRCWWDFMVVVYLTFLGDKIS